MDTAVTHSMAGEALSRPKGGRKVLLSAMRNEAAFLLEWVAYHKAIGFERIIIAANPSDDGTDALLKALDKAGEVSFLPHVPLAGVSAQASAMKLFDRPGVTEPGDWVIWLDADEFLVPLTGAGRVDDLIAAMGRAEGALINWRIFGDSGHARFPGRFVSPDFSRASRRTFFENRLVKTFFRQGPAIAGWQGSNLHRPLLRREAGVTEADFLGGNGKPLASCDRNATWLKGEVSQSLRSCEPSEIGTRLAQINHYCIRTPEHFLLKRARGRGWVAGQAGDANSRHSDEFYAKHNRNDEADTAILRHEAACSDQIARLMAIPAIAKAQSAALKKVAAKITALDATAFEAFAHFARSYPAPPPPAEPPRRRPVTRFSGFRLTFPAEPEALVRETYASAKCVLEYGSGGSTFLALHSGVEFVMSVESDKAWAGKIAKSLGRVHDKARYRVHHADIGPTGEWGFPTDASGYSRYPLYALGVFDQPWFRQPDVVLIDGRFRTACFLATMLRTKAPVTVLFDDYHDRPHYHWIEEFAAPVARAGRMARFQLSPRTLPADQLSRIVEAFSDAR